MTILLRDIGAFFIVVLAAASIENTIFARGLGVSRLVKTVTDFSVNGLVFFSLLTGVLVISAPLAYIGNKLLLDSGWALAEHARPLMLALCAILAFLLVLTLISVVRPQNMKELIDALPISTFNTAFLGPLLISNTNNYSFMQTMGFALGSALGYGLAILLLGEGQRKMNTRDIPSIFKGLPINLIYTGILALAIYGLTGRRLPF